MSVIDGLLSHPAVTEATELSGEKGQPKTALFSLQVRDISYSLAMEFPVNFPLILPIVKLIPPSQYGNKGFHDHVNWEGDVCYTDKLAGVFVDTSSPEKIIKHVVADVLLTLEKSLEGHLVELQNEFEGYWRGIEGSRSIHLLDALGENYEKLYAKMTSPRVGKRYIKAIYRNHLEDSYAFSKNLNAQTTAQAYHVPLPGYILPPEPGVKLDIKYVRELLATLPKDLYAFYKKNIASPLPRRKKGKRKKKTHHFGIIFSMERPSGGRVLFGVEVRGSARSTFFNSSSCETWSVNPLQILRHYPDYLTERGGSQTMSDVSVAIVGCGAVGSRVAEFLIQAGVQNMVLVDPDYMSQDNIYRHLLGGSCVGLLKASCLSNHLKYRFPKLLIKACDCSREDWVSQDGVKLVDLVIDATGDLTGMRELNKYLIENELLTAAIYTFVEPYSLGGHALFVPGFGSGCFECLVASEVKGPKIKCTFLEPYQTVAKDMLGCSSFIPFTATDAVETASMTCRLAIEALTATVSDSTYRCWKGNSKHAESASLKVKSWFEMATKENAENEWKRLALRGCTLCRRVIE